jgi:hypothetical protein
MSSRRNDCLVYACHKIVQSHERAPETRQGLNIVKQKTSKRHGVNVKMKSRTMVCQPKTGI